MQKAQYDNKWVFYHALELADSIFNPNAMRRTKIIKKNLYWLNGLTIKKNQIYREDCLTFMAKMRNERLFVDAIVTSPPYNVNLEYGV